MSVPRRSCERTGIQRRVREGAQRPTPSSDCKPVGQPPGSPVAGRALKQIPSKRLNVGRRQICPELFQDRTKVLDTCPEVPPGNFGPSVIRISSVRARGPPRPTCQDFREGRLQPAFTTIESSGMRGHYRPRTTRRDRRSEQHRQMARREPVTRGNLTRRSVRSPLPFRQST